MNRAVLIFGVLVLVCGATWYALKSRVRPANTGEVVVSEQPEKPLQPGLPTDTTEPETREPASVVPFPTRPGPSALAHAPSSDTIPRNPPNGMIFAGTGKYQLYRQGDLTWRLNTDTGWACILFATDVQWSKPRVYNQGCATPQTISR